MHGIFVDNSVKNVQNIIQNIYSNARFLHIMTSILQFTTHTEFHLIKLLRIRVKFKITGYQERP